MKFKSIYLIGICISLILIGIDIYFFYDTRWFLPFLIISIAISIIQFWLDLIKEKKRNQEIENKFLEFSRNLVESVKSGIPIPKSILNIADKDYGALNPFARKLANQIEWGIPTRKALITFAEDTENHVIKRSVSIMIEAEESGGDISDILSSVVDSVVNVKKMKEERRASVYSQIVQGYIVFFIFIGIMLILQLWLFPKLTSLSGPVQSGLGGLGSVIPSSEGGYNLDRIFFSLITIQSFFAGIMIGKFTEGTLKTGLIHSFILMLLSALIITTVKGTI